MSRNDLNFLTKSHLCKISANNYYVVFETADSISIVNTISYSFLFEHTFFKYSSSTGPTD